MKKLFLLIALLFCLLLFSPKHAFAANSLEVWCNANGQSWVNETLTCTVTGQVDHYGYLDNYFEPGTIENYGTIHNYGIIENEGSIINYAAFENHSTIRNFGSINNRESGSFYNHSDIDNFPGGISNSGTFYNYGTIGSPGGIANYGSLYNHGGIINCGTFNNYSNLVNEGDFRHCGHYGRTYNHGRIENHGTLNNDFGSFHNHDTIENYGSIRNENGAFYNDGSILNCGDYLGTPPVGNQIEDGSCVIQDLQELGEIVEELDLQQGLENGLNAKLETASKVLEDSNEKNDVAAVNALRAFIRSVEAQRGKKISDSDADTLIANAQALIDALNAV